MSTRESVAVGGVELSVLRAGSGPPTLLLLHGTFWSRVWQPLLDELGASMPAAAFDFPGFGRSPGELTLERARVPELAALALDAADALGARDLVVAGHDIGGAVAQHLAVHQRERVRALVLVNSVLYDSWPVPAVARYSDPDVRASTTPDEFRAQRRTSLSGSTARTLDDATIAEYLSPWDDEPRIRSWMAMASAADPRYTQETARALAADAPPTLLVWGQDDEFQPVTGAERFAREVGPATLVRVPGARHIPMEDDPDRVAGELATFLEAATLAE